MFKGFRWQVAAWFLGLSSILYLACSVIGGIYFYSSQSHSMDEELKVVASQIGHAIDLSGKKPTFRDWLRVVETEPARSIMSMQLYDTQGKLLEHYGPLGIPELCFGKSELSRNGQSMRMRQSPLLYKGTLVGFLQLEIPTAKRSALTRDFVITMGVMAPFILLGFGLIAYVVSGIAVRPVEKLVSTLQQFVADAGHELNTPAGIIQARAQSLERKLLKQSVFVDDLKIIVASAERMGYIIKNLMLLAEIDSRQEYEPPSCINMKELVETSLEEFSDRYQNKNITLRAGVLQSAFVQAERASLHCIVSNLLENAFKYTEAQGEVEISCILAGSELRLSVEDNGIGIAVEHLPHVFDRFYRVDKSRSRESGGTGLGLSIVKALAESLGGRVEISSTLGKGSQFQVVLPVKTGPVIAQDLHTSSQQLL